MMGTRYLKFGTAVLLLSTLAVSGCETTTYLHKPEDTKDLTQEQARKLLIESMKSPHGWCANPTEVTATYTKLKYKCAGDRKSARYSKYPVLLVKKFYGQPCVAPPDATNTCLYFWKDKAAFSKARDVVRAWYVLSLSDPVDHAGEEKFDLTAKSYREAPIKPELPEGAVRFKAQAEGAVREKRFDAAADLYEEGLGVAPWWPAGHYNRGLILGELKEYDEAVDELKRYLKVDPEASNARAVQLKIYEWEGKKS